MIREGHMGEEDVEQGNAADPLRGRQIAKAFGGRCSMSAFCNGGSRVGQQRQPRRRYSASYLSGDAVRNSSRASSSPSASYCIRRAAPAASSRRSAGVACMSIRRHRPSKKMPVAGPCPRR